MITPRGFFFRWSHNCRHNESWRDPTERRGHVFNQIHSMTLILWHLHCSFSFEVMAELSHPDQRFLLEKFLEDINVPTLTLWGDKDKVRRNTFDWDVWNTRISCLYTPRVPTVQLSFYWLGLRARFNLVPRVFRLPTQKGVGRRKTLGTRLSSFYGFSNEALCKLKIWFRLINYFILEQAVAM